MSAYGQGVSPLLVQFRAGSSGGWRVTGMKVLAGDSLEPAERIGVVVGGELPAAPNAAWSLKGTVSNLRYTTGTEARQLGEKGAGLGRPEARLAALIPIRKSAAWWSLPQDRRREIYEERSRHTTIGLEYLPAISRRLHHSRDLGEPFDFLTWFEFAPEHEPMFDDLLARLRSREEWDYVDREVDIRLTLEPELQ